MNNDIIITVSNFGPIKAKTSLSLRQCMVFSGPSGVGKSYLAMLLSFVYRIFSDNVLLQFFKDQKISFAEIKSESNDEAGSRILYILPKQKLLNWINQRALLFMRNMLNDFEFDADIDIQFPNLKDELVFKYLQENVEISGEEHSKRVGWICLEEQRIQIPDSFENYYNVLLEFLLQFYLSRNCNIGTRHTFFMPPSRGSLVAVPDAFVFQMKEIKGMYMQFLNDLSYLKSLPALDTVSDYATKAKAILHSDILQGDILLKDNDFLFRMSDSIIPISATASSIKELTPFALMIQKGLLGRYSILFEEPESHLHPELQVKVADLLAYSIMEGAHLQVTTHSDYFLRRFNDLIRLHVLKESIPDVEFEKFCSDNGFDPNITIDSKKVGAYYISKDSEGNSVLTEQNCLDGIPFDTFSNVVKEQVSKSIVLNEYVSQLIQRDK